MADSFDPVAVESGWYDWWDSQGFFAPQMAADGKPHPEGVFVMPLPPPTVNGSLHIGHTLAIAIEDALSRWCVLLYVVEAWRPTQTSRWWSRNRMLGKTTWFVPGLDHGGLSTEYVVEKRLHKLTGRDRYDIGREKLLHTIQAWNTESASLETCS
jgi:valyl-tRNA synthetase